MDWNFSGILSPYLLALGFAYAGGQFAKILIDFAKNKKMNWREFFKSGHMPSTHTASMVALTTVVGFHDGWGSAVFAIAAATTLVIIYDATHVRRAVGEQGLVLRKIIDQYNREIREETNMGKRLPHLKKPYFSRGHLPVEVIVGGIVGVLIGFAVSIIMF